MLKSKVIHSVHMGDIVPDKFTRGLSEGILLASMRAASDLFQIISSGIDSEENKKKLHYYQTVLPKLKDLAEAMNLKVDNLEQRVLSSNESFAVEGDVPQALTESSVQSPAPDNPSNSNFSGKYCSLKYFLSLNNVSIGKQPAVITRMIPFLNRDKYLLDNSKTCGRGRLYLDIPEVRIKISEIISRYEALNQKHNILNGADQGHSGSQKNSNVLGLDEGRSSQGYGERGMKETRIPYSVVRVSERTGIPEEFIINSESVLEVKSDEKSGRTYNLEKINSLVSLWNTQKSSKQFHGTTS